MFVDSMNFDALRYSKALSEVESDILNGVFDDGEGELVDAEPTPSVASVANSVESMSDTVLVQSINSKKTPPTSKASNPPSDVLP